MADRADGKECMKTRGTWKRSILVGLAAVSAAVASWSMAGLPHALAEARNPRGLAVIIGNGEYRSRDIPPVDYAGRDAEAFRRYVVGVLGFDAANVIHLRNATKREMLDVLGDPASVMNDVQARLNILGGEGDVDVVVYYSGHGVPGRDGQPFLLPVDVPPHAARAEGYPIDRLYRMMGRLRGARSVRVFLDTCFSGSSDGGRLVTGSPVYQETAFPETVADGMMVMTAVTKTQIATWDKEAKHGLFTHHLLDGLYGKADGDEDGRVTGVEAKEYLDRHMTAAAWLLNRREQQATLRGTGGAVLARADGNGIWMERPPLGEAGGAANEETAGAAKKPREAKPVVRPALDLASVRGGEAMLAVRTEPRGAKVLVSGAQVGETPLFVSDLRAGTYTVTLDHPTHETVILENQNLADRRVLRIERSLKPATGDMTVLTQPSGAWVKHETEHLADSTPVTLESLPSGALVITLGKAEHRTVRVDVQVPKGDVALVEATLEKIEYGTLRLEVEPSDAQVTLVDGSPYRAGMRLAEGEYRIRVTREGYREGSRVVRVSGDTRVRVVLEPAPQPFTVVTTPAEAAVRFVDGRDYRPGMELLPGTYRVRVSAERWETQEVAVRHGKGATVHKVVLKALAGARSPNLMVLLRESKKCHDSCQLSIPAKYGQAAFSFAYRLQEPRNKDSSPNLQLELGGDSFEIKISAFPLRQGYVPFHFHQFSPPTPLPLYGFTASRGVSNSFYHYFVRDDGRFYYLGEFPMLLYDSTTNVFFAPVKDGPHDYSSYYRLDGHQLEKVWQAGEVFQDCEVCPEMVVARAGKFQMGSPESQTNRYGNEGPRHRVRIGERFGVGKYEVTFAEWDACVAEGGCRGYRPDDEGWGHGRRPVINVSWEDAKGYVEWLSEKTGQEYRLLTETEWEYVARAGTDTSRYWGESEGVQCKYANGAGKETSHSWRNDACRDGYERTALAGSFAANGFGLHDVLGNVWEWVEDCWRSNYEGAPWDGSAWVSGGDCSKRVVRGGSWVDKPRNLRSANRSRLSASVRGSYVGFRIARTLIP